MSSQDDAEPLAYFDLLALPSEIRELVYRSIFNTESLPSIIFEFCDKWAGGEWPISHTKTERAMDSSVINLQLTCRQVYEEANPLFYQYLLVTTKITAEFSDFDSQIAKLNDRFCDRVIWLRDDNLWQSVSGRFANLQGLVLTGYVCRRYLSDPPRIDFHQWLRNTGNVFPQEVSNMGLIGFELGYSCWFYAIHEMIDGDLGTGDQAARLVEGKYASTVLSWDMEELDIVPSARSEDFNREVEANPTEFAKIEDLPWPQDVIERIRTS